MNSILIPLAVLSLMAVATLLVAGIVKILDFLLPLPDPFKEDSHFEWTEPPEKKEC